MWTDIPMSCPGKRRHWNVELRHIDSPALLASPRQMKSSLLLAAAFLAMMTSAILAEAPKLYSIPLRDIDGRETSLAAYSGKVLLIVNVASQCGYTPQYAGLEALWRRHKDAGLVVLGFPCNDFGEQ